MTELQNRKTQTDLPSARELLEELSSSIAALRGLERTDLLEQSIVRSGTIYRLLQIGNIAAQIAEHYPELAARSSQVRHFAFRGVRDPLPPEYQSENAETILRLLERELPPLREFAELSLSDDSIDNLNPRRRVRRERDPYLEPLTPDTTRPSEAIDKHRDEMIEVVAAHGVSNPRIFGSVLYGNDGPFSDIDILVDPGERTSLFDLAAIQDELERITGFNVDVATSTSLVERIRARVLAEARAL